MFSRDTAIAEDKGSVSNPEIKFSNDMKVTALPAADAMFSYGYIFHNANSNFVYSMESQEQSQECSQILRSTPLRDCNLRRNSIDALRTNKYDHNEREDNQRCSQKKSIGLLNIIRYCTSIHNFYRIFHYSCKCCFAYNPINLQ